MSMLYAYKPLKDRALYPACHILMALGVTPNMVTAAGLIMSLIAGLLAASGHLYVGIVLFAAGACLDVLDGSMARACGRSTEFGRYFDSICDRLSELALVGGAVTGGAPAAAYIVVAGSYILLASRVYNHRKGLNSDAAMFGRPERLTLLVAGLLAPAPYDLALFAIAGLLCVVSSALVMTSGVRGAADRSNGQRIGPELP
jgi:phosphatidylglycerophosphate synthase